MIRTAATTSACLGSLALAETSSSAGRMIHSSTRRLFVPERTFRFNRTSGRVRKFTSTPSKQPTSSPTSAPTAAASNTAPATSSGSSNILIRLWQGYSRQLDESPLRTKTLMAALIFFVSDSATQAYERSQEKQDETADTATSAEANAPTTVPDETSSYDLPRALSGAAFGVVGSTWLHYWWNVLERVVPTRWTRLQRTTVKVALDQGIGAPLYLFIYYLLTNVVSQTLHLQSEQASAETSSKDPSSSSLIKAQQFTTIVQDSWQHASALLWPTLLRHWRLWPLVHMVNFYYVPLHHRVLVQNCVLVGWSAYLSHLNNNFQQQQEEQSQASSPTAKESEQPPATIKITSAAAVKDDSTTASGASAGAEETTHVASAPAK